MGRSNLASVKQRCLERAEDGENLLFADGYDEATSTYTVVFVAR